MLSVNGGRVKELGPEAKSQSHAIDHNVITISKHIYNYVTT